MKWIELTGAVDGQMFLVNSRAIESVGPRGEDFAIVSTITSDDDGVIPVMESYEQIKAMLMGEKPAEQPDIDEAKRIAFRTGYETGVKEATKHSRWIINENGDAVCESCGYEASYDTDFCPGCGADMREEGGET